MSKFSTYAGKVNAIAKAAFAVYNEAAQNVKKAEARYNSRHYDEASAARAKADLLEAQQALKESQAFMQQEIKSVQSVGRELQEAVDREYSAKGEEVDLGTLELLKSGIVKPKEYFSLYETAKRNGNNTMCRLIGKYAGEAADKAPTREMQEQLHTLSNVAHAVPGKEHMDAFNVLEDAYKRTANNPSMIPRWGEITDSIIESF